MSALDYLSVASAVATFVGTWIAIREARRAKTAAKAAEGARDQILILRANLQLATVLTAVQTTQQSSRSLLAPARMETRGKALSQSIDALQKQADQLGECEHLFSDAERRRDFTNSLARIRAALTSIHQAGFDQEKISLQARDVHDGLTSIASLIRKQLDTAT